jgi:nicotinate-nucleotide pyrophosphorylase (carboxylating)
MSLHPDHGHHAPPHPATDLNTLSLPALYHALSGTGLARRLLELARDEDLGLHTPTPRPGDSPTTDTIGDITSMASIAPDEKGRAALVARAGGVISGLEAVPDILGVFGSDCTFESRTRDGDRVECHTTIGELTGPIDEILEVERTLLNLVGRLSGIATKTSHLVAAIAGVKASRAMLFDTRKTTPGLRMFEKYAVRCGGGHCHRIGLYDAVLLKDNHLAGTRVQELAAFVKTAADRARKLSPRPLQFIEVEVDSLDQFEALLTLPKGTIDIVLLDNMGPALLKQAAARRDAVSPGLQLEASGGITLETIPAIAATGVDRISTGSVTHSVSSLDVALDIVSTSRGH